MNGDGGPQGDRRHHLADHLEAAAAKLQPPSHYDTDTLAGEIGAQLRLRRGAALRLPPLQCGHRDPLRCLLDTSNGPQPASYCCSSLGLEQITTLARMGWSCSATTCARLAAS